MMSMKKTLLSVMLLSTASAFSMTRTRELAGAARARIVSGAQDVVNHKFSALVATSAVALATKEKVKNLRIVGTALNKVNDTVSSALKIDKDAISKTAAREAVLQAINLFGPENENIEKVVHGLRYVNFAKLVEGSGHLNLVMDRLPALLQNDFTRFALSLATTRALAIAGNNALGRIKTAMSTTQDSE